MNDVTRLLAQIDKGDDSASERLLEVVYGELRNLAAAKLAREKPGQTLQATALVHEAYLRLRDGNQTQVWANRGHFFAAAAEAMRRILVGNARRKKRLKRGGNLERWELEDVAQSADPDPMLILTVDDALDELAADDATAAAVVKLHFFAGLTLDETAVTMEMSRATVYRYWAYARAWLKVRLQPCADAGD